MEISTLIRPATVDDAPAIHAMLVDLARYIGKVETVTSTPEDIRRHGFGASPAFRTLIATRGGKAVGLALYFDEFSTWRGRRGVYLQDLYVAPDLRGSGLGRLLVKAVVARAAADGAVYLRLAVDEENEQAARFYARLGFIESPDKLLVLDVGAFAAISQS